MQGSEHCAWYPQREGVQGCSCQSGMNDVWGVKVLLYSHHSWSGGGDMKKALSKFYNLREECRVLGPTGCLYGEAEGSGNIL